MRYKGIYVRRLKQLAAKVRRALISSVNEYKVKDPGRVFGFKKPVSGVIAMTQAAHDADRDTK